MADPFAVVRLSTKLPSVSDGRSEILHHLIHGLELGCERERPRPIQDVNQDETSRQSQIWLGQIACSCTASCCDTPAH